MKRLKHKQRREPRERPGPSDQVQAPEAPAKGLHERLSVVIPHVTDPFLGGTVDSVLEDVPGAEVIVVQDGAQPRPWMESLPNVRLLEPWAERRGIGPARDAGIANASREIIVLLDAHMRLKPGCLKGLVDVLDRAPEAVACASSGVCRDLGAGRMGDPSYYYSGARLRYQTEFGMPLEPGWCRELAPGTELSCALGGCYAIRKARYEAIGVPWRRGVGWGSSEQTLCAVNWFLGGRTVLAAAEADHVYYDKGERKSYEPRASLVHGWAYNRLRLLELLPIPEQERNALRSCVFFHAGPLRSLAWRALTGRSVDEARDAMSLASRTWEEACAAWWGGPQELIQPTSPPPAPPPPSTRPSGTPPGPVPGRRHAAAPGQVEDISPDGRRWL